ncbi:MAG: hypothetical protein FD179_997 [Erysipelotrichaceae bacterium]|nr:MAG: hypothetical protein FD179_997 [Erysipelotrichaceae bacterium]
MRKQPNRPKRYKTKPKDFITRISNGDVLYFYKSIEWNDTRRDVLKRDKHECQRCNGNYDNIDIKTLRTAEEVHHILGIKERPELCLQLSNLVSLCHKCHDHIEGRWITKEKKESLTVEKW